LRRGDDLIFVERCYKSSVSAIILLIFDIERIRTSFSHIGTHAINVLARLAAKNAVKEELKAQNFRVSLVPPSEIAQKTKAYLDANPHLYEEAYSRAWKMGLIKQSSVSIRLCLTMSGGGMRASA